MGIEYRSFCWCEKIPAKSKEVCKKFEFIKGLSAEKLHFLHKNRLLLYEQL